METYGRNRESIADIEQSLEAVFSEHPAVTKNAEGEKCVPVEVLPDILGDMLGDDEVQQMRAFADSQPGLLVSPNSLVGLLAALGRGGGEIEMEDESSGGENSSDGAVLPQTPNRPNSNSVFDTHRRQRSTPLGAPSSWSARPAPPSRRKSDAGRNSDGESYGRSLSRTRSRTRVPSTPTSPSMSPDMTSPKYASRPSSRVGRHLKRTTTHSPEMEDSTATYDYLGQRDDREFVKSVSSLPMPSSAESDDDDDDDDDLGLVMDRAMASSTVSMEQSERLEALQKVNQELSQRVAEGERVLRRKIEEHENEIEVFQTRLEELSSELAASKREEKDLRGKERGNISLIGSLEAEVAKVSKNLENSRVSYVSLQKLYQEQCTVSETYRSDLRHRDERIRLLLAAQATADVEGDKYRLQSEAYEARISELEKELEAAQAVQRLLDEQKQENLLLKETIDRMRFDIDELRDTNGGGGSGPGSLPATISKTLGREIAAAVQEEEERKRKMEEMEAEEMVEDGHVIQTIITRTRKVASRANRVETMLEESLEYSDTGVQYEPGLFAVSAETQTVAQEMMIPLASSSKVPIDESPPAYVDDDEHDFQIAASTLKKWHAGVSLPISGVKGGVSGDVRREWARVKSELGVGCGVVDRIVEASSPVPAKPRRKSRLYNIYNTYVYEAGAVVHGAVVVGASALVLLAVAPYVGIGAGQVHGGATYYDRAAWSSFNNLGDVGGPVGRDGAGVVWSFLGRVGGGAARGVRGWPT